MTVFVRASMEVGSLTLDLFIIKFEMLLLFSLGMAFGKKRFLKGWHSLYEQQFMIRFLLWIILYFMVTL